MAWRDSRGSRRQLALFLSSMIVGVAALVAITSFGDNLRRAVDDESKALLGADLIIGSDNPFSERDEALFDSLGGEQSRILSFASMAYFPRTGSTRLSSIRAVAGGFPFYGEMETTPRDAAKTYLKEGGALVDATLMTQYDIRVGDSVRIGRRGYPIVGSLEKTPRENEMMSLFSPRIYIPQAGLDSTLLGVGARLDYDIMFKFDDNVNVEATAAKIEPYLEANDMGYGTVEETREDWDESLTNMYRFLSIVAFIAVLLGGIGVASAIYVYIRRRLETIAILRCVGAEAGRTFGIYAVQAAVMGFFGGLIGAAVGIGIQGLVPLVLQDFLPVDVPFELSWSSVAAGMALGIGVTIIFALLPLISIRKISPLLTLRSTVEHQTKPLKDPLWWMVLGLIVAGMTAFAMANAPEPLIGLGYTAALGVVFLALLGVARLLIWATRRFFPSGLAYTWRQGIANLFRPNNQTSTLVLSLGLGTFLIATLFGIQKTLLSQIEIAGGPGRPNVVFFDIQPDQIDGVAQIVEAENLPIIDRVPIITMRLAEVKGRSIEELRADSTFDMTWAHWREYRSTYRGHLVESEQIVSGEFVSSVEPGARAIPVSIEQDISRELEVEIGDTLVFDVQGLPVTCVVGSIREVDWRRIATNFFVVFPEGVLEDAPQFYVLLSRTETSQESAEVQRKVVQQFPSISAIDLSLVLNTFDAIFSRISFVVRFMASFSILTGLIVLVGAVVVSRLQRARESVLLKTLGASKQQVIRIMVIEYLFLGFFAALTGLALSTGGGWAVSKFVFELPFHPDYLSLVVMLIVVPLLTIGIGMINSRGIYARPPLEVLRAEV